MFTLLLPLFCLLFLLLLLLLLLCVCDVCAHATVLLWGSERYLVELVSSSTWDGAKVMKLTQQASPAETPVFKLLLSVACSRRFLDKGLTHCVAQETGQHHLQIIFSVYVFVLLR